MSDDLQQFPVIEEDVRITKRATETERVRVRLTSDEEQITVREQLLREAVEVRRVPIDREVAVAPPIRTEGDVTIVPIVEERLVVEKRLVLVEELHLHRHTSHEEVSVPATVRRTRVDVTREPLNSQENP